MSYIFVRDEIVLEYLKVVKMLKKYNLLDMIVKVLPNICFLLLDLIQIIRYIKQVKSLMIVIVGLASKVLLCESRWRFLRIGTLNM